MSQTPHNGLECPRCGGHVLAVKDSRRLVNAVRRRRLCVVCRHRSTTYEVISQAPDDVPEALRLYEKFQSVPDAPRHALTAMLNAVARNDAPRFAPPLIPPPEATDVPKQQPAEPATDTSQ